MILIGVSMMEVKTVRRSAFFIWLAENISTFFGIWRYPNQLGAWSAVHVGKWSSWSLLVVMTFTIVANLKHNVEITDKQILWSTREYAALDELRALPEPGPAQAAAVGTP